MKIIEISRTISGNKWDNVSAKATVDEDDDPISVAVSLDNTLCTALKEIKKKNDIAATKAQEVNSAISLLKTTLKFAEDSDIPF